MMRPPTRPHEAGSLYVGPQDRYVVSLIVAYGNDDAACARDAALGALGLLLEGRAPRTQWCVYDRASDRVHLFEQRDLTVEEIDPA